MSHYFESGFSYREAMWHGLGKVVDKRPSNVEEGMEESGLNWKVEAAPMYAKIDGEYVYTPENVLLYRDMDKALYGVVSNQYEIIQNKALFEFAFNLLDVEGCFLETAGSLKNGAIVWVMADLGHAYEILGIPNELTRTYLVLTTSHDGKAALKAKVTDVRVVCYNTYRMAFSKAGDTWSIRHIGDVSSYVEEARNSIGLSLKWSKHMQAGLEFLAKQEMEQDLFEELLDTVWPVAEDASEAQQLKTEQRRDELETLYEEISEISPKIGGTKYAALNAVTEQLDYLGSSVTSQFSNAFMKDTTRNTKAAVFNLLA